jgi:hypothetical protein
LRNRVGSSEVNRRRYLKKTKSSESKPTATTQKVVPAATTKSAAGIVVAAPGAAERAIGQKPVSTTITGREIQVDDEGRMKLDNIKKMDPVTQFFRGTVVPTEQMVGIAKDVAYGVKSEDQRSMESGLDLLINPVMKPYTDPRMESEGVITDKWYWPEELKTNWNVLPAFMQKSDTVERRSFLEGVGANVGNIGAISQSPLAGAIRDEEFAVSADRFSQAPGYYIGSAAGEIPYFIIGVGQVKAVGTVAAKATAGVVRGSSVANQAKVISTAYKIERATEKLQKVSNKADDIDKFKDKVITKPEVLKAVKLLRAGYAKSTSVNKKGKEIAEASLKYEKKDSLSATDLQTTVDNASENIKFNKMKSNELDKFDSKAIEAIEKLPSKTEAQRLYKQVKIDRFNAAVQDTLLPEMRKFKEGYVAQASGYARGTRTEKLARAIEGSPNDVLGKIDRFFNRPASVSGDSAKKGLDLIERTEIEGRARRGLYSGVMGNIKLNKDLFGGVVRTSLGISRSNRQAQDIVALVSKTVPFTKSVTKDELFIGNKSLEKFIEEKQIENREIRGRINKKEDVEVNKAMLEDNIEKMRAAQKTIDDNKSETARAMSFTRVSSSIDKPVAYRYDIEAISKIMGKNIEDVMPKEILLATNPSVNVRKVKGVWQGSIGDDPEFAKSFFITKVPRSEAVKSYTQKAVSKEPSIFRKIGTRKVGRFRTAIPRKAEPMEEIVHFYDPSFAFGATANKGPGGVKNIVALKKSMPVYERNAIKRRLHLKEYSGDKSVAKSLGADDDKILLEYDYIRNDSIMEAVEGVKSPKTSTGQDVRDILIQRAVFENNSETLNVLVDQKLKTIDNNLEQVKINAQRERIGINQSNRFIKDKSRNKARKKLNDRTNAEIERLTKLKNDLLKRKSTDFAEARELRKDLQIHDVSDQRGALISMPLEVLKKEQKLLDMTFATNVVKDKKTGKQYYIGGKDSAWYEITSDNFRPSMVSEYKNVQHSTQTRVNVGNTDEGFYYTESLFGTSSTKPTDKLPKGVEPPRGELDRGAEKNTFKYGEIVTDEEILSKDSAPIDPGWVAQNKLNVDMQDNLIRLDNSDSYKGVLKKLTKKEQNELESGIVLGKVKTDATENLSSVNRMPDLIMPDYAKKTDKKRVKENTRITKEKQVLKQTENFENARNKINQLISGDRFVEMRSRDLRPDDATISQRSEISITRLQEGDAIWVSGFETNLSRLFGSSQSSQVTQPVIPQGVRVSPIQDLMPTTRQIDEIASDIQETSRGKRLDSNKGTNYDSMLTQARYQGVEREFKERTAELVFTKIRGLDKPDQKIMKKLLAEDSQLYKKEVESFVSTRNNELFKTLSRKEATKLKLRNKGRKEKKYVIDPNTAYSDIMEGSIDKRNPIKRIYDDLMDKSQVRTEPQVYLGKTWEQYRPKTTDGGTQIVQPKTLTRMLRSIGDRRKKKQNIVITEQANPYIVQALRELSQEDNLRLAASQSKNKRIAEVFEQVGGSGETVGEGALKAIAKSETDVKLTELKNPFTGKKLADTIYEKQPYFDEEKGKWMEYDGFVEGRPSSPIDPESKLGQPWEQGTNTFISEGEKVRPRGAPASENILSVKYKETLEDTKNVLRSSIEDALGIRSGPVTSSDRKNIATNIMRGFTDEYTKRSSKQQKNIWYQSDNPIKTLEEWLGTPEAETRRTETFMKSQVAQYDKQVRYGKSDQTSGLGVQSVSGVLSDEQLMKGFARESKPASGIRQTAPAASMSTTASDQLRPSEDVTVESQQQSFELPNPFPMASAEPQQNIIDQTIGDVQKTLDGITTGNQKIGQVSSGMTVKTYEAPSSLRDVIGSINLDRSDIQSESSVLNTNILEGLKLGQPQDSSTIMIPSFDAIPSLGLNQAQRQVSTQAFTIDTLPKLRTNPVINKPVLPKPMEQRFVPTGFIFPLYDPVEAAKQRRSKIKKKKTKKTWWQTPENWYEPYYWGGKNQMGSGYVTFTGKEPAKVRKYEKRFFGIGVNDTPFGVRSKWF